MALAGPYVVACVLLVLAGTAKARRPGDTTRALGSTFRLPATILRPAVRAVAAAEVGVGLAGLVAPVPVPAGLVALSYLAFTVAVVVVRARGGPISSCGCFGTPDTPATASHVAVTAGLAVSASVVAVSGSGTLGAVLFHRGVTGAVLVVMAAVATWLTVLVLVDLARLHGLRARLGPQAQARPRDRARSGAGADPR